MSYAQQRGILLRRENPTYWYWAPVAAATRGFKMVLFTGTSGNNYVGGTCAPPSALLVELLADGVTTNNIAPQLVFRSVTVTVFSRDSRGVIISLSILFYSRSTIRPSLIAFTLDMRSAQWCIGT